MTNMANHTSVQVSLPGMPDLAAQSEMFAEFGTAPGTGGHKDTLVDVAALRKQDEAKPLPGQITMIELA